MYLEVTVVGEGMHPSEVFIEIDGVSDKRQAFYHGASVLSGNGKRYINVDNPVSERNDTWLVDIGREMTNGAHRVWVFKDKLVETVPLNHAKLTWGQLKTMVEAVGATDDTPIDHIELYRTPAEHNTATVEVIGGNLKITEM